MARRDVSDEIELKNGKANPFGWSTYDIFHCGGKIGNLYCGEPRDFIKGYSYELKKEDEKTTRLIVYWDEAF
jgi:hypothetical protein